MQISEPAEAVLRDVSASGLSMETSQIVVDGLHISYDRVPTVKNRLYLQWELPTGRAIKAVGETMWYERVSAAAPLFVVGLRFIDMSREDREAFKGFLEAHVLERPVSV
jgi:hypothetical protein